MLMDNLGHELSEVSSEGLQQHIVYLKCSNCGILLYKTKLDDIDNGDSKLSISHRWIHYKSSERKELENITCNELMIKLLLE